MPSRWAFPFPALRIASHFNDLRTPVNRPDALLDRAKQTRGLIVKTLLSLLRDDAGATAIEYGLIAGLIALAIIGGVTTLGTNLATTFSNVASSL